MPVQELHQALVDHADELREPTIAEVGAARALTRGAQLDDPIEIVRSRADVLRGYRCTEDLGGTESRGTRHHHWLEREAARVVAAIIAYDGGNYFGADSPFGGFKQSGIGRETGVAGLAEVLERKTFAIPAEPAVGAPA